MMTECNQESFSFTAHFSRGVQAEFTSRTCIERRRSASIAGGRRQDQPAGPGWRAVSSMAVHHWLVKHPACRRCWRSASTGLALGYEDLCDHEQLRSDPLLGLLSGKRELDEPLAGKSTLNRLELTGRSLPLSQDQLLGRIDGPSADGPLSGISPHRASSPDRARSGCDRHPALRPSAGTVLSWLLRQLLLSAAVHLRR